MSLMVIRASIFSIHTIEHFCRELTNSNEDFSINVVRKGLFLRHVIIRGKPDQLNLIRKSFENNFTMSSNIEQ